MFIGAERARPGARARGARAGAGGGRHDVRRRRAGPPRVLVGSVEQALDVGEGVNGGHVARVDAEVVLQHLHKRDDAVGRAGGVRDHLVALGVVVLVVYLEDEGGVDVLGGGGDRYLLGAALEVLGGTVAAGEDAGGLHDNVGAARAPGALGRGAGGGPAG